MHAGMLTLGLAYDLNVRQIQKCICCWIKDISLFIIMTLRLQAPNNDFLHVLINDYIMPFNDQLVHFCIYMELWVGFG